MGGEGLRSSSNRLTIKVAATALVSVLVLVGALLAVFRGYGPGVLASHDGVTQGAGDEVAIDMVSDSSNTANTLGTIQHCVSVAAGTPITFDVVIDGIPPAKDLRGFNYMFAPASGSSLDPNFFVTAASSVTGGQNILTAQGLGTVLDLSSVPGASAALNGFTIAVTDLDGTAETSPPTPRGVMTRFTIATTNAANGVYKMALTDFELFNAAAASYPIDTLLDGEDGYGVIAIGDPCPAAPPTPTPTPTPTEGDTDGDGVSDTDEPSCGGDPFDANKRPERLDLTGDNDGDTQIDEGLPPGSDGFDCDGDGWTGAEEMVIYSAGSTENDQDACGNNGWPADLDPNNAMGIGDFNSFTSPSGPDDGHGTFAYFGHPVPDAGRTSEERWNLGSGANIGIGDLNALNPQVAVSTARPPMLAGTPAFGKTCPWPP